MLDWRRRAPSMYLADARFSSTQRAEFIADYFAGCALVPRRALKQLFDSGVQRVSDLAVHFDVSCRAMQVRLAQVGLNVEIDGSVQQDTQHWQAPPRSAYFRSAERTTVEVAP